LSVARRFPDIREAVVGRPSVPAEPQNLAPPHSGRQRHHNQHLERRVANRVESCAATDAPTTVCSGRGPEVAACLPQRLGQTARPLWRHNPEPAIEGGRHSGGPVVPPLIGHVGQPFGGRTWRDPHQSKHKPALRDGISVSFGWPAGHVDIDERYCGDVPRWDGRQPRVGPQRRAIANAWIVFLVASGCSSGSSDPVVTVSPVNLDGSPPALQLSYQLIVRNPTGTGKSPVCAVYARGAKGALLGEQTMSPGYVESGATLTRDGVLELVSSGFTTPNLMDIQLGGNCRWEERS
jgi:hypothetical protein